MHGEGGDQRLGCVRRRRHRCPERNHEGDLAAFPDSTCRQVIVEQQGGLARRRWALERGTADADDGSAAREFGQHVGQPLRAGDGVELVPGLGEPWRGVEVVVGAERDDQDVGLVHTGIGRDTTRGRIDRDDRLLQIAHAPATAISRYGRRTASRVVRPNITSSFEYPKTNASLLSIRTTATSSPSASDSSVASSSPPKPAPRTTTRSTAPMLVHPHLLEAHREAQAPACASAEGVWRPTIAGASWTSRRSRGRRP